MRTMIVILQLLSILTFGTAIHYKIKSKRYLLFSYAYIEINRALTKSLTLLITAYVFLFISIILIWVIYLSGGTS